MPLLKLENVKMYYSTRSGDVHAVDDVTLSIERGRSLGVAGESGCGKSSLAATILRLLPRNGRYVGGKLTFDGRDMLAMSEEEFRKSIRWKRISMVFQGSMNALNPVLRVGDQISEAILNCEGVSKADARARSMDLLKLVGISPARYSDYPHEFSGGMKQRAVIAMALACNPDLIIADEPTTALDVMVQVQVLSALQRLREELHLSMILISHDLSVIAQTCDDVAIMYAGKIVESGSAVEVFKNPMHPYTKGLLAAFPDISAERTRIGSIPGSTPNLVDPPIGCRFRERCPLADEECARMDPTYVRDGDTNHMAACLKVR